MNEPALLFFLGWAFGLLQAWSVAQYMERKHGQGAEVPWFLLVATAAISLFTTTLIKGIFGGRP